MTRALGAKVDFPERREIANTLTIIPIHFQCPVTLEWKVQSKDQLENRYTMLWLVYANTVTTREYSATETAE